MSHHSRGATSKNVPVVVSQPGPKDLLRAKEVYAGSHTSVKKTNGRGEIMEQELMIDLYWADRKYQFMETQMQRKAAGLKDKIPDIQKTLETVRFLKTRTVGV